MALDRAWTHAPTCEALRGRADLCAGADEVSEGGLAGAGGGGGGARDGEGVEVEAHLADVAVALADGGRARARRRRARVEVRAVLGVGLTAPGGNCNSVSNCLYTQAQCHVVSNPDGSPNFID